MKANLLRNRYGLLGLFIVTLFFSSAAFAQKEDIKLTKVKDDFTSEVTIASPKVKLGAGTSWELKTYFLLKEGMPYLAVYFSTTGNPIHIDKYSVVFDDGETFKKNDGVLTIEKNEGAGFTASTSLFMLTPVELEKFTTAKVTKMRTEIAFTTSSKIDVTLKEKVAEEIKSGATALFTELSKNRIAGI